MKPMRRRAAKASGSQWRGRDEESKGEGEGIAKDVRRNDFIKRYNPKGRKQMSKEGQERN